ncbi:hypothetical protein NEHOM01_1423 [Nematocida homosporus]|uniref:uncharacterized protein n=1 Tax=Nematocida homosporus TaxID=1912981 RepID=UPI00221E5B3C|nr:uncharacterized protein NEHOM01_1423 [Nematocida homosporus]KAI5186369.1 hypothetical protein NEHOM01_1423 [Nematocida homosporus]
MRKVLEALADQYRYLGISKEKERAIERYSDKYRQNQDGTVNLIPALIENSEEYPQELVKLGFGHGVKCQSKGASIKALFMQEAEINSEVEESEASTSQKEEESEENDYMAAYLDDDEMESDDEIEDVM